MSTAPALALVQETGAHVDAATTAVDLLDEPHLDPEAQVLCALLWSDPVAARTVVDQLLADDFDRPVYGELFAVIARLVRAGHPHSSPLVLAQLEQTGRVHGQLSTALLAVTLADARDHEVRHLAYAVIAMSYRRGYNRAAHALAQLAEEAPTEDLFEQMCALGRNRRDAKTRLDTAAEALL